MGNSGASEALSIDTAKIAGAIAAVLYVIGFMVVSFHLGQFGIAPVTWARPQYLVAGIWCLLPLALFACGLAFGVLQFAAPWIRYSLVVPRATRRYRYFVGTVEGLACLIAAFSMISVGFDKLAGVPLPLRTKWYLDPGLRVTLRLAILTLLVLATAFCGVAWLSAAGSSDPEHSRTDRVVAKMSAGLIASAVAVAFAVSYIWYFSVAVYATIPPTLGGGKPQTVVFVLRPDTANRVPIEVDVSGARSVPYQLLLRTDNTYVVRSRVQGQKAIEFSQNAVSGMIVVSDK